MKPLTLDQIANAIDARPLGQVGRYAVESVSIDSREVQKGELFFAIRGERFDGHDFVAAAIDNGAMAAVVSDPQRVPEDLHQLGLLLLVDDTTAALGRLAAFHRRQVRATVVAVTGSNGKTTTKEMIHQVLRGRRRGRAAPKSFNNNVGVPLTLLSVAPDDDYVVVEIGTNAPGEIAGLARIAVPDIGVITGVAETHLEKLGSIEGVAEEKASLLLHLREGGCAIVNGETSRLDPHLSRRWRKRHKLVRFGRTAECDIVVRDIRSEAEGVTFSLPEGPRVHLPIPGEHNALNAAAAIAVGREFAISDAEAAERLAAFVPPPMRMDVRRVGRITMINDAYNANPASMAAALDVLRTWPAAARRVFVAGDMRELGASALAKHEELGARVARTDIDALLTVGEFAGTVVDAALRARGDLQTEAVGNTDAAANVLAAWLRPGDVVLLKGSRAVGLEVLAGTIEAAAERFEAGSSSKRDA